MADLRDPLLDALGNAIKLEKTLDIAGIYTLKSPALQEDFNQDAVGFLQSHNAYSSGLEVPTQSEQDSKRIINHIKTNCNTATYKCKSTVKELKAVCSYLGISSVGVKDALVQRI